VEWNAVKARLRDLATQHHGRITDFGSAVELVPSDSGEPIFVAYADVDLVRVDAGWFIRRFVDVEDDMQHLTEVLDALITGNACEFIGIDDESVTDHGYRITYRRGSISSRPEATSTNVTVRRLPPWPVQD
jgi:hypothetical protein